MAHVQFTDVQDRPLEFLDLTSLTLDEFQQLVPPFEAAFQAHMAAWRLDGKPRTARLRIPRISATQSTVCCHPRSVATLDCMMSLCALLLSMALWWSPLRHPVSPRCYRGSRGVHHRYPASQE